MKAIVELSEKEYKDQSDIYKELKDRTQGMSKSDMFDNYKISSGYAHYKFSGTVSSKLLEALGRVPASGEIIMLVDGGFSHFGASCNLNGKDFSGRVNTD